MPQAGHVPGTGRRKSITFPVSGWMKRSRALWSAMSPLMPAVFAVAPERVAAGRELHPYLVGAPGVEGDVREAGAAVRGEGRNVVFQHSLLHALARTAHRKNTAFPAVLE